MLAWLWELYYVFVEPILVSLGVVSLGLGDPTYGRDAVPYSAIERATIYDNPAVRVTRRRAYLSSGRVVADLGLREPIATLPCTLNGHLVTSWVNYYVWEMPSGPTPPLNADVFLVHGINDYSGKVAPQALKFMEAGFRAVALDMPSFGRSSGLHAYLPSLRMNVDALSAVMQHVCWHDQQNCMPRLDERKRFAQGSSMGGFTVIYHAALYPPVSPASQGGPKNAPRLSFAGLAVSAPMLQIAKETRPNWAVEMFARAIAVVAGRLPLARALKGNVSDDPRVEEYATVDPQIYHGLVRIDTGLGIVAGLDHLSAIESRIRCPVAVHHGTHDRVTNPDGSRKFLESLSVPRKQFRLWPGVEHAMLKSIPGMSAADTARRDALVQEMADWFTELVREPPA
ncbi:acylglycerol lipase [Malassezia sp. CBS 17886]|nr:acylglycerol lipase [Malassezia sp. CBS 17886]